MKICENINCIKIYDTSFFSDILLFNWEKLISLELYKCDQITSKSIRTLKNLEILKLNTQKNITVDDLFFLTKFKVLYLINIYLMEDIFNKIILTNLTTICISGITDVKCINFDNIPHNEFRYLHGTQKIDFISSNSRKINLSKFNLPISYYSKAIYFK